MKRDITIKIYSTNIMAWIDGETIYIDIDGWKDNFNSAENIDSVIEIINDSLETKLNEHETSYIISQVETFFCN